MSVTAITPQQAGSLAGLFRARVQLTPDTPAYRQYDNTTKTWTSRCWRDIAKDVARWQAALQREGLRPGDRIAIMLRNSPEWISIDLAALGLGLVTVPLYMDDRADNLAYVLNQAEVKWLFIEGRIQWRQLAAQRDQLTQLRGIVSLHEIGDRDALEESRLTAAANWLAILGGDLITQALSPDDLATLVYTSGTTGRPKGVMLSHRNILENAYAAAQCAPIGPQDLFLSFLPLSHMLERTGGCFLPMMVGAEVAFARSIPQLAQDLITVRPSVLVSVPRIYESVYAKIQAGLRSQSAVARWLFQTTVHTGWNRFERQQGRSGWSPMELFWPLLQRLVARKILERLGGRLTYAICGGAPLPPAIARFFIGLGLPVYHGYGMTEASPVVSVNRPEANWPASIGKTVPGVEVKLGENDELLVRGPSVMLGYWQNEQATAAAIDAEGWLHSGDKARIDPDGFIFITGRIKDIIVLGNGEKLPPADMEMAITLDPLFEQVLIIGEGRAFLSALVVLNAEAWQAHAATLGLDPQQREYDERNQRIFERSLLERIKLRLQDFPGYARIRRITALHEPWSVENGLLTPTMKMKRERIAATYAEQIDAMYADYEDI